MVTVARRGIGECIDARPATDQIDMEIKAHILCHHKISPVCAAADSHNTKQGTVTYENQNH